MHKILNTPNPARLIEGLRDTGYDFNNACADIIDNSISAEATEIIIEVVSQTDGRKFVFFGDNGIGMNREELFNAMRYGADRRANLASLGKFGLGLKTASTSIARKLSVLSKKTNENDLIKLSWDLDHVVDTNEWELLEENPSKEEVQKFSDYCGDHGTLVIWSKCDRLLSQQYEVGEALEIRAIQRIADRLREHVAMIYYRFLDHADTREVNITIDINHNSVEAWNPFFIKKSEQVLAVNQQKLEIVLEDGTTECAYVKAYILPHERSLSKDENKNIAKITNKRQGFYIHREGRIIHHGGWLNVFGAVEPHGSLLRVEFDYGHKLDVMFHTDVKKSSIIFDQAIEEELRSRLAGARREANTRYRQSNKKVTNELNPSHLNSNNTISSVTTTKKPSVNHVNVEDKTISMENNRGPRIVLKAPIDNNVDPKQVSVEAVETITNGDLWEPAYRSSNEEGHIPAVRINKHHDFYQKIYKRAASHGFAVEGMDLLLWAFSVAEFNNSDDELKPVFEDFRQEISFNLTKLLRNLDEPSIHEIE